MCRLSRNIVQKSNKYHDSEILSIVQKNEKYMVEAEKVDIC